MCLILAHISQYICLLYYNISIVMHNALISPFCEMLYRYWI